MHRAPCHLNAYLLRHPPASQPSFATVTSKTLSQEDSLENIQMLMLKISVLLVPTKIIHIPLSMKFPLPRKYTKIKITTSNDTLALPAFSEKADERIFSCHTRKDFCWGELVLTPLICTLSWPLDEQRCYPVMVLLLKIPNGCLLIKISYSYPPKV